MKRKQPLISETIFVLGMTLVYAVIVFLCVHYHEMWRDEVQPWLIARYSPSLSHLMHSVRYEGHPGAWYIVLFGLTRVSTQIVSMQLAHAALATLSAFIFLRYAPWPRSWRALFVLGFYPLYQYAVVSRGYVLCVALIFIFCILFQKRRQNLPLLTLVLLVTTNMDVYGWFYVVALSAALAYSWYSDRRAGIHWQTSGRGIAMCILLVCAGMAVSVFTCIPPPDGGWYTQWNTSFSFHRTIEAFYGLIFDLNFGNRALYVPFNVIAFVITTLAFLRRRTIAIAWVVLVISLYGFYYLKFIPCYYHRGMVMIFWVACLWMMQFDQEYELKWPQLDKLTLAASRCLPRMVHVILAFYALYSVKWLVQDFKTPYSCAKGVAEYIKVNNLTDRTIICDTDFAGQGVSAYLGQPVYYPANDEMARYVVWNRKRHSPLRNGELVFDVSSEVLRSNRDALVVLNYEMKSQDKAQLHAQLMRQFAGCFRYDENFWLYLVECPGKREASNKLAATRGSLNNCQ